MVFFRNVDDDRRFLEAHQQQTSSITPANKMNPAELTASLSFLSDAGHLLAITAPETSAYLMGRRNDLMFEHELTLSDKHRQHVCSCCGRIMLLGQGTPSAITRRKAKPEKVSKASRLEMSTSLSSAAQETASQKTTSNASSKKRAKSRKAGLQALLNQSSASRNSGPGLGLSLADFMQK
ncbi:hypothetical protein B0I37DRAFT_415578 [Chaetomium sp. MPI-CAGE-AT-0009]|nr:hypothetical protein B0I37DRAFT_415578 [Chaetomium sp. MPI-CAGE-AT-0009]